MRDKITRRSRGVAFLLYLTRPEALACVAATHNCVMFDRTLQAHMARDNGRAAEFVRRREYPDKSRCYECGDFGHLSYSCPKNTLGCREPPKKKTKSKKRPNSFPNLESIKKKMKGSKDVASVGAECDEDDDEEEERYEFEDDSLGGAIRYMQELREAENFLEGTELRGSSPKLSDVAGGSGEAGPSKVTHAVKKSYRKSDYFSDEEELE